ncbi:MAG: glutathione S-transferase family protein [Pseudomonadota bacterium]|nr:glutathione S-transferase family protein [Pseudomonadota bacterium]
MKLYDFKQGPNPRRVRIFLAEKGLEVPLVHVDILKREQKHPDFLKKNPIGSIPVLELEDGTCISESVAICRYFEEMHPEPPLFGTSPVEKATIEMWLRRVELNFMVPVGMVWIHGHPLTARLVQQIPEVAEQNRKRAQIWHKLLDDQLAKAAFVAGKTYTVVDAVLLATLDFATNLVGIPYDEGLTHLKRWHDQVSARPSAAA